MEELTSILLMAGELLQSTSRAQLTLAALYKGQCHTPKESGGGGGEGGVLGMAMYNGEGPYTYF